MSDGATLAINEWWPAGMPKAQTLLFLHFFGGSGDTWREVCEKMSAQGYTCVAPDQRGFGASAAQKDGTDFSLAAMTSDALALCRALAPEPVVIVAHSMGGKITLAALAQGVPNVAGIVLLAASPPVPEPMSDADRARMLAGVDDETAARATAAEITAAPLPLPLLERFLRDSVRVNPAAWRSWLETENRLDISAQVGTLPIPALVAVGDADKAFTAAVMRAGALPHLPRAGDVRTVAQSGHLIPLEQPAATAALIAELLQRVR